MLPLELARLHQAVDRSMAAADRQNQESDFVRTAKLLVGLAASILIISGVWLAEFPSRHAATLSPGVAVVPASDSPAADSLAADLSKLPAWERTALTLRVEPMPALPGLDNGFQVAPTGFADASSASGTSDLAAADWMLSGLGHSALSSSNASGGNHANP
jgi:hypothetical protein